MSELKKIEDLQDFSKYKTDLAKSVKKVGKVPAPVLYVKKFSFKTKTAPLALVGPVDGKLKSELVSQKADMKTGKCVRREDGKLVFDAVNAFQIKDVLQAAQVPDEIDPNGDFKTTGFGGVANVLEKHLNDSGRSTSDQGKREVATGKILAGMEKATNERNKAIDPSKPESHHVSAHGPGTDQITRLVAGRRPDEIQAETAKGKTPDKKVTLTGNTQGVKDTEMPVYDKVGQNASTRSGAFTSNVAMLHTIEEAYSQVAQLDSHLETVLKSEFEKKYQKVIEVEEVKKALEELKTARKLVQMTQKELKQPGLEEKQVLVLKERAGKLQVRANELVGKFEEVFKANGGRDPLPRPDEMHVGDGRVVRNVTPGSTGKGFLEQGLGSGYEIQEGTVGKQKKGAKLATGGKTEEEVLQERFEAIKPVTGQKTATAVMDPAYVVDDKGNKRRAGWDVQTAYPNSDPGQQSLSEPGAAEKFVNANKEMKKKAAEFELLKKDHAKKDNLFKTAQKAVKTAEDQIKIKQNLVTTWEEKKEPEKKISDMKGVIQKLVDGLPALKEEAKKAEEALKMSEVEKNKKEEEMKKLKTEIGGDEE